MLRRKISLTNLLSRENSKRRRNEKKKNHQRNNNMNNQKDDEEQKYFHPRYEKRLRLDTADLFSESAFLRNFDENTEFRLWNGRMGTANNHMEWFRDFIKKHGTTDDGYRKIGGRREGNNSETTYEIHDELTEEGDGCGFFRVKTQVDVPPDLFLCFMMDANSMANAHPTFRVLDYSKTYPPEDDATTKFAYCRMSPSFFMKNVDFFDLTGYRRDDEGRLYSLAISCDTLTSSTATSTSFDNTTTTTSSSSNDETSSSNMFPRQNDCNRALDMYRGWILTPNGRNGTDITALYQGNLNSGIPHFLTNRMIGNAMSEHIRVYEKDCQKLMLNDTAANQLLSRHGFPPITREPKI